MGSGPPPPGGWARVGKVAPQAPKFFLGSVPKVSKSAPKLHFWALFFANLKKIGACGAGKESMVENDVNF